MPKRKRADATIKETALEPLYSFAIANGEVGRPGKSSLWYPAVCMAVRWWRGCDMKSMTPESTRTVLTAVSSWWKDRKKRDKPHKLADARIVNERAKRLSECLIKCDACGEVLSDVYCDDDQKAFCFECMQKTHECNGAIADHLWTMLPPRSSSVPIEKNCMCRAKNGKRAQPSSR